jgi:hypothetical protein
VPNEIEVTALCQSSDGHFLLPAGTAEPGSHVLVQGAGATLILKRGYKGETAGTGACVSGSALSVLGGEGSTVSYRGIGTLERIVRDRRLLLQAVISLLTFVGACLTAYTAWIKTNASTAATGWEQDTAAIALIIAALLALLKLYREINEL